MKTKKKEHSHASRFSRGEKTSTKSTRRHARKHAAQSQPKDEFVSKLEELTPL